MWFYPIDMPDHPGAAGTVAALLQERFETYKRDMRANFFDSHFASFNRQVMLVDVLSALYGGRAAFEDTARAIAELGAALRYGANTAARGVAAGMIRGMGQVLPGAFGRTTDAAARSLATRRIERVTFVATKADHVPAIQRDNLRNLVRALAHAKGNDPVAGAPVTYQTAAAIRSTQEGTSRIGDRPVRVVMGVKLGEATVRPFYVGDVPSAIPPESFWAERYLDIPPFRPPPIDATGLTGIPHLDLDLVLDDVMGDLL
jgi:predicted YcjX-like family ATPase